MINQLNYLLPMLSRADQKPGMDAYQRLEGLNYKLSWWVSGVDEILDDR